jgi:hypothetical protein
VLAHGQIVTTDLAVALFVFLSVIAFQAVTDRLTATRVLLAGLATGAALASKFSALVLVPILAVLAVVVALSAQPLTLAPFGAAPRNVSGTLPRLAALALALVAIGAIALGFVWATYAFHPRLANDPEAAAVFSWSRLDQSGPARATLRTVHALGLLPDAYVYGLATVLRDAQSRPAFLFGHVSEHGWWYYFPATFLLKTPLALLALLALPLFGRREEGERRFRARAFLWLPVVIYAGVTLTRNLNIGHRHLLPIYPFLFAAAGAAAAAAFESGRSRRWAVVALAIWYGVAAVHVHPHYLGYFNELVGGPSQGLAIPGRFQRRLGPGPEGAEAVDPVRDVAQQDAPGSPADRPRRATRRAGRHQRDQPSGRVFRRRRAAPDESIPRPHPDRSGGLLDLHLPAGLRGFGAGAVSHVLR